MTKKHALVYLTAAVWLTSGAPMASGVDDKKILGTKVMIRTPVDASQNTFSFNSKDPNIHFGANNDSDTPTTNGASVLVFNPNNSECQCIIMPAARWTIGVDGKRYSYRDTGNTQGPVRVAFIRERKMKIFAKGNLLTGITLDDTTAGGMGVHVTFGDSPNKLCAAFDGTSVRVDRVGAFIGKDSPPQGVCFAEPAGCTP